MTRKKTISKEDQILQLLQGLAAGQEAIDKRLRAVEDTHGIDLTKGKSTWYKPGKKRGRPKKVKEEDVDLTETDVESEDIELSDDIDINNDVDLTTGPLALGQRKGDGARTTELKLGPRKNVFKPEEWGMTRAEAAEEKKIIKKLYNKTFRPPKRPKPVTYKVKCVGCQRTFKGISPQVLIPSEDGPYYLCERCI